jgi:diguanylate cyclase (GGDEF)-like protein
MEMSRNLSVRQNLWFGVSLAVMVVLIGAGLLHHYRIGVDKEEAEKLRAVAMAESYAAQVAPSLKVGRQQDVATFVERIALHPSACLLAVFDRRDHSLAARGNTALIERFVRLTPENPSLTEPEAWSFDGDSDRKIPPLTLVAVPIVSPDRTGPLGFLVYAARLSGQDGFPYAKVGQFFAGLAVISLAGVAIGFLWLHSRILQPIADLADEVRAAHVLSDRRTPTRLAGRDDEIGAMARTVIDMRTELREWRGRASHLEHSMDHHVAAETQRITRELRQAEKKVTTDPLTHLGNRRLLLGRFTEIFEAQRQAGRDLSVILIDVDHFKEVNDTLGHKAGDELLVFVGELLQQCLREEDLAIRYGGDEFLLILPSVHASNAASVAERTMRLFAQQARVLAVQPKPSMSAGIASILVHHPATAEDLLELADQALYEAKRAGKSQVRIASGLTVTGRHG